MGSRNPDLPLPSYHPSCPGGGTLRHSQPSQEIWSLQHVPGVPRSLPPTGHAQNTSPRMLPGVILIRCLNPLNWLHSKNIYIFNLQSVRVTYLWEMCEEHWNVRLRVVWSYKSSLSMSVISSFIWIVFNILFPVWPRLIVWITPF